jgi:hypothetical protein
MKKIKSFFFRYSLEGGEEIILGDIKAKFLVEKSEPATPEKLTTGILVSNHPMSFLIYLSNLSRMKVSFF